HRVPRGCGAGRRTDLLRGPVQLHSDEARGGRPARMVCERPGAAGDGGCCMVRPERRPCDGVTAARPRSGARRAGAGPRAETGRHTGLGDARDTTMNEPEIEGTRLRAVVSAWEDRKSTRLNSSHVSIS